MCGFSSHSTVADQDRTRKRLSWVLPDRCQVVELFLNGKDLELTPRCEIFAENLF